MFVFRFILVSLAFSCYNCEYNTCGLADKASGLIIGGTEASRGKYPWLAALFFAEKNVFFCGGSLISKEHILTGNVQNILKNVQIAA